jgi:hypothetical protein
MTRIPRRAQLHEGRVGSKAFNPRLFDHFEDLGLISAIRE